MPPSETLVVTTGDEVAADRVALNGGPYRSPPAPIHDDPLGRLIKTFGPIGARDILERYLLKSAPIAVPGLICIVVMRWVFDVPHFQIFGLVVTILGVFMGVPAVFAAQMRLHPNVAVHEHGLRYRDEQRRFEVRWEALTSLRVAVETGKHGEILNVRVHLASRDQKSTVTDDLRGILEFGDLLETLTREMFEKRLAAVLDAGRAVALGSDLVTAAGIVRSGTLVPWRQIAKIERTVSVVRIPAVASWHHSSVDNSHALISLVTKLIDRDRQRRVVPPNGTARAETSTSEAGVAAVETSPDRA
jgi:ribosomal protein S28E/S33